VGLAEVARTLAVWALAGLRERLTAAYRYFCLNHSPSEIAHGLWRGKYEVRGWMQRLYEVANAGGPVNARHLRIARLVGRAYEELLGVEPAVVPHDGGYYCRLCERYVATVVNAAERHVSVVHRELVEELTARILRLYAEGRPA
jgi:hypothetical protein